MNTPIRTTSNCVYTRLEKIEERKRLHRKKLIQDLLEAGFSKAKAEEIADQAAANKASYSMSTSIAKSPDGRRLESIKRFLTRRCAVKYSLLEQGESEDSAEVLARKLHHESMLEESLRHIRGDDCLPVLRSTARELVEAALGEPASVEFQWYRWAEKMGAILGPYQSLADKLAANRMVTA